MAVALLAGACGGDGGAVPDDADAGPSLSPACRQAFVDGHDLEVAGTPTNEAFLPSVEACGSMAEWTAAAEDFGVDLQGREAIFVDGVCAAADEATRASDICLQAQEQFRRGT